MRVPLVLLCVISVSYASYMLPKALKPVDYEIHLIPYFDTQDDRNFTFDGSVSINLIANESTSFVVLHAYNMTIQNASFSNRDTLADIDVLTIDLSKNDTHFLVLELAEVLVVGANYTLNINYLGVLNADLDGFYRSSFIDSQNGKTWLAATQFSPTGARRAFPCWDEPIWKATFTLHIAHPPGYKALSNMPQLSTSDLQAPANWTWTHFQQTPVMSTFIVGFTVSPFAGLLNFYDPRFIVWARRDAVTYGGYANTIAPRVLSYMETYTAVPYAMAKMDQVAIPDFAPNAMENWGMINYRETALLFVEGMSTTMNRQRVATVISHEEAHQWFGNLVSPAWWGYVWLKEGFARYFEYHALAQLETEWKLPEQFVQAEMRTVFKTDALDSTHPMNSNVSSPATIAANFDSIAYNKGGCIVRFLVKLIGEEGFKNGINKYLTDLAYGNALPEDLWKSLSPFVPEGVLPNSLTLSEVMSTWTDQPGFPVIHVVRDYNETVNGANITQQQFLALESDWNYQYYIPITFTSEASPNFDDLEVKSWHLGPEIWLTDLPVNNSQWIMFNVQQMGYYRVNYDVQNWRLITAALNSNLSTIHEINRAQVMDDALTVARTSMLDYGIALDTTSYLNDETEYTPWSSAYSSLGYIYDRLSYQNDSRELFEWYAIDKMTPMYGKLGGVVSPTEEGHVTRLLRELILGWSCLLHREDCNNDASDLFFKWQAQLDPNAQNPIAPDLKTVVYCAGMRNGGRNEYNFLLERYGNYSNFATEQSIILTSIGCSSDTAILQSYLDESIAEDSLVRKHDARSVITAVYNNYLGVDLALDFLLNNYNTCAQVYGGFGAMGKVFSGLSSKLNTQEHRNKLQTLLDTGNLGQGEDAVKAAIKTVDEILKWHENHRETVLNYFSSLRGDSDLCATASLNVLLLVIYFVVFIFTTGN